MAVGIGRVYVRGVRIVVEWVVGMVHNVWELIRKIKNKLVPPLSLILLLLGIIIVVIIFWLAYNEILSCGEAIQSASVSVLVLITIHYTYQTYKLAETSQKMMEREMKEYLLHMIQPITEEFESKREIFRKRQYDWNWNEEGEENLHIDMPDEINHTLKPLSNDSLLKSSEFKKCCEYCEKEYLPRSKELITQLKQLVSRTDAYLKENGCYNWFFEVVYTEEEGGHFINRHDGGPVGRRMIGPIYKDDDRQLCNGDIRYFVVRKMIIDHIDDDDERQESIEDLESEFPYGNMENVVYTKIDEIIKVICIDNNDLINQMDKLSEKLEFHAKHLEDELKKIIYKLNEKYCIPPVGYNKK